MRWQQEVQEQQQSYCHKYDQRALQESLPGAANWFFFGRKMVERHYCSAPAFCVPPKTHETRNHSGKTLVAVCSLGREPRSTVLKVLYRRALWVFMGYSALLCRSSCL